MTPAGQYFYEATGRPAPSSQFDRGQPLVKKGAGDYVKTRNGKLALVRKLQADGTTTVSRLGKLYFRGGKTEYIVSVPAIVTGKNARGKVQSRRTMLPVDLLGLGPILRNTSEPEASRIARVKSHVLKQLAIRTQGGATVLMEISSETFTYDRPGEWLISSLTTEIQDGEAGTSALMRQPLAAGPLSCAAFLPYADEIVDCAFDAHDDLLCVPRQMANVLRISLNEAISYFDDFHEPGWQARGVAPLEL